MDVRNQQFPCAIQPFLHAKVADYSRKACGGRVLEGRLSFEGMCAGVYGRVGVGYLGLLELGDLGVDVLHALELHARLGALARLDGRVHLFNGCEIYQLQARDSRAIQWRTPIPTPSNHHAGLLQ